MRLAHPQPTRGHCGNTLEPLTDSSAAGLSDLLRKEANRLRAAPGPVPMGMLLNQLGIRVSTAEELAGGAHGILRLNNGSWEIVLPAGTTTDAEHLSPRHRFTVAHEIGHIILYEHGVQPPRTRRAHWQIEELCNGFAGRLLISDADLGEAFPQVDDLS